MKRLVAFLLIILVLPVYAKNAIVKLYGWNYSQEELQQVYSSLKLSYHVHNGKITDIANTPYFEIAGKVQQIVSETLILLWDSESKIKAVIVPDTTKLEEDQKVGFLVERVGSFSYANIMGTQITVDKYSYIPRNFSFGIFLAEVQKINGLEFPEIKSDAENRLADISRNDDIVNQRNNAREAERRRQRDAWIRGSNLRNTKQNF